MLNLPQLDFGILRFSIDIKRLFTRIDGLAHYLTFSLTYKMMLTNLEVSF